MFHRAANPNKKLNRGKTVQNQDIQNSERVMNTPPNAPMKPQKFQNRVESSAVERYAKSQNEMPIPSNLANENVNAPMQVPQQTQQQNNNNTEINHYEEDMNSMNNPEPQTKGNMDDKKAAAPQGRDVNIPGNNFQRPGGQAAQPAAAARPTYPGSYAANTAANNPYGAQGNGTSGRKLVIGQGITMSGEIEACEHLIVEGTIEATLKGANVLDVYESGAFHGTVEIDEANIAGRFEGDITVKGRLTIESTGVVIGSVSYKELSMEAGATIDGSVSPIGSTNATANTAKKSSASKAKKAKSDNGAELPFADKAAEAAE